MGGTKRRRVNGKATATEPGGDVRPWGELPREIVAMIASYTCVTVEPLPFTCLAPVSESDSSAYHRHEDRSFSAPGAQFASFRSQSQQQLALVGAGASGSGPSGAGSSGAGPSNAPAAASAGSAAGAGGAHALAAVTGVFRPAQMSRTALAMRGVCRLWCEVLSEAVRRILLHDRDPVTLWAEHFPNLTHLALGSCSDFLIREGGGGCGAGAGGSGSGGSAAAAASSGRRRRPARSNATATATATSGAAVRSLACLSSLRNLQVNDTAAHLHLAATCTQLEELVVCSHAASVPAPSSPIPGNGPAAQALAAAIRLRGGEQPGVRAGPAASRRSALDLSLANLPGLRRLRLSSVDASAARLGHAMMELGALTSLRLHQCNLPTFFTPRTMPQREGRGGFGKELIQNLGAKLQDLSLQGCCLSILPAEVLAGLPHLRTLDLSANWLRALPSSITLLTELEYLDLQHNALGALPEGLGALSRLADLDLSMNQLQHLPADFRALTGLTHLNLGGLHQLDTQECLPLLTCLTNLHSLGLSDIDLSDDGDWVVVQPDQPEQPARCPLAALVSALGPAGRLRELVMDGCGLDTLPASFSQLTALSHLSVMENFDASGLPESITCLRGLQVLHLGYLDLSVPLPAGLFEALSALRQLDLEQNFLPHLSADVSKLSNLQVLNLVDAFDPDADMGVIPWSDIYKLTRLRQLAVSGTDRPQSPNQGISALYGLEVLQLRGMPVPARLLEEICSSLRGLSSLECTGAGIRSLPASITRLGRLMDLQLSSNTLSKLPQGFGALTRLTELALKDNPSLRALPADITNLTRLHSLSWSVGPNTADPSPPQLAWMARLPDLALFGKCRFAQLAKANNIAWGHRSYGHFY